MTSSSAALLLLITTFYASPTALAFVSPSPNTRGLTNNAHLDHIVNYRRNTNQQQLCTTTTTPTTRMNLFGFGKEPDKEDQKNLQENDLARFSHLVPSSANPTVKFDSLSIMINEWSKLFTDGKQKMGLTTPVMFVELTPQICDGDNHDGDDVTKYSGIQLLFNKKKPAVRAAYKDKDDEKSQKDGDKEKDEKKEGGVEVRVEQLSTGDLQVVASRCEIDEDTMVKEMSEEVIIDSLRKAVAAWKKEQEFDRGSVSSPMS